MMKGDALASAYAPSISPYSASHIFLMQENVEHRGGVGQKRRDYYMGVYQHNSHHYISIALQPQAYAFRLWVNVVATNFTSRTSYSVPFAGSHGPFQFVELMALKCRFCMAFDVEATIPHWALA